MHFPKNGRRIFSAGGLDKRDFTRIYKNDLPDGNRRTAEPR
jgi:hypothetical protein